MSPILPPRPLPPVQAAREGKLDPVIGRDEEIRRQVWKCGSVGICARGGSVCSPAPKPKPQASLPPYPPLCPIL